jgi:trans-aconitate 2-methyltransferase
MPDWNPTRYLQFSRERELPCRDLISRIAHHPIHRITDLGCGPGNSTAVIRETFPHAEITGIDSSPEMLATAGKHLPEVAFINADIREWIPEHEIDLIFSNAALQWLPNHEQLFPHLISMISPGGYLAVQMPYHDPNSPISRLLETVRQSAPWSQYFHQPVRTWSVQRPADYYNLLCGGCDQVDIWSTDYYHPLPDADAVIDWYSGTSLRPWMDSIPPGQQRESFLDFCRENIRTCYPLQADGRILFSIRRLFLVGRRRRDRASRP